MARPRQKGSDRKPGNHWLNPLGRLVQDPGDVSEYLENLREIRGLLHDQEAWRTLEPIKDFFKRSVAAHFECAERELFPAV